MKESKAVYVTKHKIRYDLNQVYQLYRNHNREYSDRYYDTGNFGCQYDSKRDNLICTCRTPNRPDMRFFSGVPKQIYAYHGSRSFTDVGVGSVKALQRRKVKRVYLPEMDDRGVGSSDLSTFINRSKKQQKGSYYDHKILSSKCVGGVVEYNSLISQKLSPIVQTRSGSTSPKISIDQRNIEIGSNTVDNNLVTTGTQFEVDKKDSKEIKVITDRETESHKKAVVKVSEQTQKYKYSTDMLGKDRSVIQRKKKEVDKVYSSDSLVQHVHNLENPSEEKQSRASIDPMENKLEREYRRMFSTKDRDSKASVDKPVPEVKSASILRRRFEALRKGLKKEDGKKNTMPSSLDSVPSRKDASVTSDPPSLECRSFTDTKRYSPVQANVEQVKNKIDYKTVKDSVHWPQSDIDSECQGVKGMFNLWGKKFKFEEEPGKSKQTPMPSLAIDINKKPQKVIKPKKETESKKKGRKFFFFKKKSKDQKIDKPKEKEKEIYNPSGVTAGRCEITDGLILKMGGTTTPKEKISNISDGDNIIRRTWLQNFLANNITSARSVNVRWNNSMYTTSSSTVFELMDTIYKNNVVVRSRSEITSEVSSYYRSYTKNKVNFDQNIEAWMVPKTIADRPREIPVRIQSNGAMKERDIDVTISDQRWLIEKSKAFANKIEVVLRSKNFNRATNKVSSEYLKIDIPKDFFDISSSDDSKQNHTSDEEVYKIVEYESNLNTTKALDKGEHTSRIKVIVSVQDSHNLEPKILETVIKRPPMHRDVVIQGSNVNIPKRCDVIGVGIITQRDMRDIRKPILKIQDYLSDDYSEEDHQTNQKKCEFAESYLQEYYRHWKPLGIDLFSWCVSDSLLRSCSEKSLISFQCTGDGSKSCPNICEDFQTSTIISSCDTSSCSQCYEEAQKPEDSLKSKLYKKFIIPLKNKTDTDLACQRVLPKDSLEVFKRRKIYAASLKSRWACSDDKPVSVPSIESKGAQDECPKLDKSIFKPPRSHVKKGLCKKHVSMTDCDTLNTALADQLNTKKPEGILAFKGQAVCDACKKGLKCKKHAVIKKEPAFEIPDPPCKASCEEMKNPPCSTSPRRSPLQSALCKLCQEQPSCLTSKPVCKPPTSPPPTQPRPRRKACPDIQCKIPSPAGSMCPSPTTSHDCLSPAQSPSPKKSVKKTSKRNKKPCSPTGSRDPSPKTSHDCLNPSPQKSVKKTSKRKEKPCSPTGSREPSPKTSHDCLKTCPQKSVKKSSKRNEKPCSPTGSKKPSPKTSHDCLKTCPQKKSSKKSSPQRNDKRCMKCQHKLPCKKFPNCKLSSESLQRCPNCSPPGSLKASPCGSPQESQKGSFSPQRSPKASPRCSPQRSPKASPRCSPQRSPKASPCSSPRGSPKKSPPCCPASTLKNSAKCPPKKPPCNRCNNTKDTFNPPDSKTSPSACDKFPWPTNSQVSNPPSPSCSETNQKKEEKKCPVKPKTSCQSLEQKKVKECKPDCANRKIKQEPKPLPCPENNQLPCPTKNQKPCPAKPQSSLPPVKKSCIEISKAKMSGLFLKMKPLKKNESKGCLACDVKDGKVGVVRLSSCEDFTISMKRETPSTEEIREGMNIKVQDEDGNTLFERKDYVYGNTGHRVSVLGDMYKDSKVCNRASTPVMLVTNDVTTNNQTQQEMPEYKSEASLANLVQIQFTLRITQGDKTTEISIANEDEDKQNQTQVVSKASPEVFVVENKAKEPTKAIEDGPKNDINIKIVIKNYKPKPNKIKNAMKYDDEYSKKITDKFHTVSTGYSDILPNEDDDNVFSIHRAKIKSSSNEKSKTLSKPSNQLISEDLTEPINFVSSHSTQHLATDVTEDENVEKSISSKRDTQSYDKYDYTNELDTKDLDSDQDVTLDLNTSNECIDIKYNAKEEKKQLFKKVCEEAYTLPKNKENVRRFNDSVKIILTDSSDNDEMNAVNNELAKDVTYASLKPDYFRNTDSMNNYYKMESSLTVEESKATSNIMYPTGENNSTTSGTSKSIKAQGCMCSRVAERLNCDLKIGCCCRQTKIDEMSSCDIKNEQDTLLSNHMTKYVDVDTQNSKHLSNKSRNSMNLSIHSKENVQNETDRISIRENTMNTAKESKTAVKNRVVRTFSPHKSHIKECELKKLNRTTILGISDDDKIVLLNEDAVKRCTVGKKQKDKTVKRNWNIFKAADVLQCYETKKAVLEIYAEKKFSKSGEHLVAKLPKFVYEKESEITRNYEQIAKNNYKSMCRKDVIRMTING